ncbi:MAG: sigma-54 dependent transcriptional regulator [candidate division WOR-3 bacterium]
MKAKILVIDDEKFFLESLLNILNEEGYNAFGAPNAEEGIRSLKENNPDVVLLDVRLPDVDGITLLKYIKEIKDIPIIMISAYGTIDIAVEAIKNGAQDFIEKPFAWKRARIAIENALKIKGMEMEISGLKSFIDTIHPFIGESEKIKKVKELIDLVAAKDISVLITGETGTGKELVARLIHIKSQRRSFPFQMINCATIPESLFESEIFGYEKGAFTGADKRKIGKAKLADGGTLFLNEISELSKEAQAKLLRFLEYMEYEPIGSIKTEKVNVRIITATNKDPDELLERGILREDFFYRINGIRIHLPPLRERKEDIPLLCEYFIKSFCESNNIMVKKLTRKAMEILISYEWPGNVRELKSVLEKAVILSESEEIEEENLKNIIKTQEKKTLRKAREEFERMYILETLIKNGWKIEKTAKELGISRSQLFRKIRKLKINFDLR